MYLHHGNIRLKGSIRVLGQFVELTHFLVVGRRFDLPERSLMFLFYVVVGRPCPACLSACSLLVMRSLCFLNVPRLCGFRLALTVQVWLCFFVAWLCFSSFYLFLLCMALFLFVSLVSLSYGFFSLRHSSFLLFLRRMALFHLWLYQ